MLYPFITLPDGSEVVYSEIKNRDGKEYVTVKFERWNDDRDDFDSMECELPNGKMTKVIGYTQEEADDQNEKMWQLQDMIMEHSKEATETDSLCQ